MRVVDQGRDSYVLIRNFCAVSDECGGVLLAKILGDCDLDDAEPDDVAEAVRARRVLVRDVFFIWPTRDGDSGLATRSCVPTARHWPFDYKTLVEARIAWSEGVAWPAELPPNHLCDYWAPDELHPGSASTWLPLSQLQTALYQRRTSGGVSSSNSTSYEELLDETAEVDNVWWLDTRVVTRVREIRHPAPAWRLIPTQIR